MNISEKKKTELYAAIHEPIMQRRITVKQSVDVLGDKNSDLIDTMLYRLNQDIWDEVKNTLNIKK